MPIEGEPACPESVVRLNLCVGQAITQEVASPDRDWEIVRSSLPAGLEFRDGLLEGTPEREAAGSLSLVSRDPGHPALTLELTATTMCRSIVTTSSDLSWCAGSFESVTFSATGTGDSTWQIRGLPPGVEQDGAEIRGSVDGPGSFPLRVTLRDSYGTRAEAEIMLEVRECPPPDEAGPSGRPGSESDPDAAPPDTGGSPSDEVPDAGGSAPAAPDATSPPEPLLIVPQDLPAACIGQDYAATLEVEAGAADESGEALVWSLEGGPSWLEIDASTGTLRGEAEAGEQRVVVRVESAAGASGEAAFDLELLGPADVACAGSSPTIETQVLARACIGDAYEEELRASGGTGSYHWTVLSPLPEGLALTSDGLVRGTPAAAAVGEHTVTVAVRSGDLPTSSRTVRLVVSVCEALVFVAEERGAERLFFASDAEPAVSEISASVLAQNERVISFAFAPDRPRLAFLVGGLASAPGSEAEQQPARLYLANALGAAAEPVLVSSPGASVLEYSWAPDGEHLAFIERLGDTRSLATVLAGENQVGAAADVTARHLASMIWAADRLCYKARATLSTQRNVLCHEVSGGGVQDPSLAIGLFTARDLDRANLMGGPEGYLAAIDGRVAFYQNILTGLGNRQLEHVFSPSLRWASALSPTDPAIREVKTSDVISGLNAPSVLARVTACSALHAWSLDDRRLACGGSELSLIELSEAGTLDRASVVASSSGYPSAAFRRAFSPDGRWYAYDAGSELRLVRTDAEVPTAALVLIDSGPGDVGGLEFSPSGEWLFSHRAQRLFATRLGAGLTTSDVSEAVLLPPPPECVEAYLPVPGVWCGAARAPAAFIPAPNTPTVAFVDQDGFLYVADAAGSHAPRRVYEQRVKCTNDLGEIRCGEYIRWAPQGR